VVIGIGELPVVVTSVTPRTLCISVITIVIVVEVILVVAIAVVLFKAIARIMPLVEA